MELPLVDPPIAAYQPEATVLSIALQDRKAWEWYYNYFVQLCVIDQHGTQESKFRLFNHFPHDGAECPFVRIQSILRDYVARSWSRLSDFVKASISSGDYVFACLDGFFIPCSEDFGLQHHPHQTLISAIDTQSDSALLSDFYRSGYARQWTKMIDIDRSFPSGGIDTEREDDPWNILLVVLLRFQSVEYRFDLDVLLVLINDYLRSTNSVDGYEKRLYLQRRNVRYGIAVYDFLLEYANRLIDGEWGDIRVFHTVSEHKKAMSNRVRFLCDRYSLDPALCNRFRYITREALIIRNLFLYCEVSKDHRRLRNIPPRVETLRQAEVDALEDLRAALK